MSASSKSFIPVMSIPKFAASTSKSLCLRKPFAFHIVNLSRRKLYFILPVSRGSATVIASDSLRLTSMVALMPLLPKASRNRAAAIAAPPVCSDVFTISTLIPKVVAMFLVLINNETCYLREIPSTTTLAANLLWEWA